MISCDFYLYASIIQQTLQGKVPFELIFLCTLTVLGSAGEPPYQVDNAFHTRSGTSLKSFPSTNIISLFNLPPSFVNVITCEHNT